jgi:hypothetical protein
VHRGVTCTQLSWQTNFSKVLFMVTFIALEAVVEGAGRVLYSSPWATTSQKSSIWQLYIGEEK